MMNCLDDTQEEIDNIIDNNIVDPLDDYYNNL